MAALLIIMGVSGVGKTTIGKALSQELQIPFFDADDFHPKANVEKMSQGIPLNDSDRLPWLQELNRLLCQQATQDGAILACSALKASYRTILQENLGSKVQFCFLQASREVLLQRLRNRPGHFMPPSLLDSQIDTLEIPEDAICVDTHLSIDQTVEALLGELGMSGKN